MKQTCLPTPQKGSYALLLSLEHPARIQVGRLGFLIFNPGFYVYTGSALGSGGLNARLKHHQTPSSKPHWHIDYLKPDMRLLGACLAGREQRLECVWSKRLASLEGSFIPAAGFGASDCREGCAAHLVGFSIEISLEQLGGILEVETRIIP